MAKIRIKSLPQAKNGMSVNMRPGLGLNSKQISFPPQSDDYREPKVEVNNTLQPTDPENANLEAEKGETVVTDLNRDGIPEHYKIGGDRHYDGGTPLNLPSDSFIFSRDIKMKVKDPEILKQFNKTAKKSGYTFADIAKAYDINKYRGILADPNTDKLQKETAEGMIANYNLKLGKLALVQESMKGFPQGIPHIAMPYLMMSKINPSELIGTQGQEADPQQNLQQQQYGGNPPGTSTFNWNDRMPLAQTNNDTQGQWIHQTAEWKRKMGLDKQTLANGILAGGNGVAGLFEGRDRRAADKTAAEKMSGDNLFTPISASQKQRGDYNPVGSTYGEFRPDQKVPIQFSGMNMGNVGSGLYAKYGGFMQQGGNPPVQDNVVTKIRRSDRVVYNPTTGKTEVFNALGKKVGVLNVQPQMMNQVTQGTPQVQTAGTTTTTSSMPAGAKKFDSSTDPGITQDDITKGLVYVKGTDGKYYKATGYSQDESTMTQSTSGKANYAPVNGSLDADITKGNEILTRLEKDGAATKIADANMPGGYRWTIQPSAAQKMSTSEKEFMTKLSSVGTGLANPDKKSTTNMLGAVTEDNKNGMVIQWQKPGDKGTYGWADPTYLEYNYWKAKNPGKTAADFDATADDQKIENRKGMLKMYGFDPTKYTDEQLKDPTSLYTKEMITGTKDNATPVYDASGNLTNASELGLVGANQVKFGATDFRPSAADDRKLGLEHLDEYAFKNKLDLGDAAVDTTVTTPAATPLAQTPPAAPDQWWLQDIVKNAGAFMDKSRIKKYLPWQATPDVFLPTPTFYDPNRELAANSELAAQGAKEAQTFSGPQAYNSRFSQLQGAAGKSAAEIMGRYNNLNVGVANTFATDNASTMNTNAVNRAGLATGLFDKTTIANQQFDNAKNEARQNMRQGYIDAITNKNNTANMNSLFPQYAVNPGVGGKIGFTQGAPLSPDTPDDNNVMKLAQSYLKQYPSFTPDQVFKAAQLQMGYNDATGTTGTSNADLLKQAQLQTMAYPGQ